MNQEKDLRKPLLQIPVDDIQNGDFVNGDTPAFKNNQRRKAIGMVNNEDIDA